MLLMPETKHDFTALAASAADGFFKGSSLEEAVVETARRAQLTPEETRRLVEKANTAVSVRLLRSANPKAGFALASSEKVLARTHLDGPHADKAVPGPKKPVYAGLPATREEALPKAASLAVLFGVGAGRNGEVEKSAAGQESRPGRGEALRAVFLLRQKQDLARQRKLAAEVELQATLDRLAEGFMGRDAGEFRKFAADSLALHGEGVRPVLTVLARYLRLGADFEKTAAIVDDRTPALQSMASIKTGLAALRECAGDIARLDEAAAQAWRNALSLEPLPC